MMIRENEYQKVGKNNLLVPNYMLDSMIMLKPMWTFEVIVNKPFNRLYTFWKPSHFYTGLEVHSLECSWRTFRVDNETITATKMQLNGDILTVKVFANKLLTEEQQSKLYNHIISSYGLAESYEIPEHVINVNPYVHSLFSKLQGTRISCPENFFEISIVSLLLQNTNISRTTSMFRHLIERYGRLVFFDDMVLYAFYTPEDILNVSEDELKEHCRLGYRAKYIKNYAAFFSRNQEADLRKLGKNDLLEKLETIKGVGTYTSSIIASSIMRDTQAIPFDAWNRKILASKLYGNEPNDTNTLKSIIIKDFGGWAGLIAMYVIENEYIDNPVVPLISKE